MTTGPDITDEIKKLIELQEIDSEIFRIKRILDETPERIRQFDAIIKDKESIYKTSGDTLKKLELKNKEKEMELKIKEETIKKQQGQLFQIKTNKEYSALQREIESAKADNSIIEEEIIKLLDDIDAARKELEVNKKIYENEKNAIEAEKKKMQDEKLKIEEELKIAESKRSEFVKGVDKTVLAKYEHILRGRNGLAIVPVIGDACSGCNMNLPPQVVNEAKLMNDLIFCGNCSRILYCREEG